MKEDPTKLLCLFLLLHCFGGFPITIACHVMLVAPY